MSYKARLTRNNKIYFQALHWASNLWVSIISAGYNRDIANFALFDHNFVELGLTPGKGLPGLMTPCLKGF